MKKIIKTQIDADTQDCYFNLNDFSDIVDISRVYYYELKMEENQTLSIKFFDKEENLIPVKTF